MRGMKLALWLDPGSLGNMLKWEENFHVLKPFLHTHTQRAVACERRGISG